MKYFVLNAFVEADFGRRHAMFEGNSSTANPNTYSENSNGSYSPQSSKNQIFFSRVKLWP